MRARLPGGGRIRPRHIIQEGAPKGSLHLSELPGFESGLPSKRIRVLFDEDAGALMPLLSNLNLNAVYVPDIGLRAVGDPSVAAYARSEKRILITFNHRDYFKDNRGIKIQDCPGIIAAKRSNQNPQSISLTALSIEEILRQLGQKVRITWWFGVKISVTNNGFLLRKHSGGVTLQYRIIPDSRGVLWFKTRK